MNTSLRDLAAGPFCALCIILQAHSTSAQTCDMRLSDFEAATVKFASQVSDQADRLAELFRAFGALDAKAAAEPEICPAGIADSREAVGGLVLRSMADQGNSLMDCGQYFGERVLADIAAAETANDSQLLIRLGEIQARILDVQARATDVSTEAIFLGLRADRLIAEHDALERRCSILSDIYD